MIGENSQTCITYLNHLLCISLQTCFVNEDGIFTPDSGPELAGKNVLLDANDTGNYSLGLGMENFHFSSFFFFPFCHFESFRN